MYSKLFKGLCDPRNLNRTLIKFQSAPASKLSTVEKRRDPFGIEGEEGLEDIVQGLYVNPPAPKKLKDRRSTASESTEDSNNADSKQQAEQATENPAEIDQSAKYEHWNRTKIQRIREADVTAEQVHASTFGAIRFDKDNVVKYHGQFDEEFFSPEEVHEKVSEKNFRRLARQSKSISNPDMVNHTDNRTWSDIAGRLRQLSEEGSGSGGTEGDMEKLVKVAGSMRTAMKDVAKDELLSTEAQLGEETLKKSEQSSKPKATLTEPVTPKTAYEYLKLKRMAENQKAAGQKSTVKIGGKSFELGQQGVQESTVQHVPQVYERPNYNEYTHGELFSLLKNHICFQNDFLVAINKPFGLPMHTSTKECRHTVIDFLKDFAEHCGVKEIHPCHRLDKDTTGVLLLAKSEDAATAIRMKFAKRTILKQYYAIVKNCPPMREGTLRIPIGEGKIYKTDVFRAVLKPDLAKYNVTTMQKDCKDAITRFKVTASREHYAFLEVYPETGLTHQIRVHLAHGLSTPIIGDHKYSHRDKLAPQRLHEEILHKLKVKQSKVRLLPLHLHCSKLEFTMPDGFLSKNWHEPIFVHARPPKFFLHTLRALSLKN